LSLWHALFASEIESRADSRSRMTGGEGDVALWVGSTCGVAAG